MSVGEIVPTSVPVPVRWRFNWIASAALDLPWFIGGALAGYAIFAMHWLLAWDMLTVWLVWYVLIDVPHFFGTYVRTYLDPIERRRRPLLLYGSMVFPLIGPTILLVSWLTLGDGPYHKAPIIALGVFVLFWAYWHVVRQH